jgi:hypothetical protein
MDYKIISFYTGHYQWDAEQLIKSMRKLGMTNYEVEYKDSLGKWEANTQIKSTFILEKLVGNDAVVWTDADSRVRMIPSLFETIKTDVALYFLPKEKAADFALPEYSILQNPDSYLQSGTMFFRNTPKTITLLNRWIELNNEDRRQWDQWTLQVALQESDVSVSFLPQSYVWVSGTNDGYPIIEHTQASRRFKNKIG